MGRFQAEVIRPIFNGTASISESDWEAIGTKFSPYESWMAAKAGATIEKLGLARVRELLAGKSRETIAGRSREIRRSNRSPMRLPRLIG